jgi:NTE family protein
VLAAAALPAGRVPTDVVTARLRSIVAETWPDDPLWITAVRLDSGRRVVFGRDADVSTDVATAVAASCAIPGFFEPVSIGGRRYVDGGAHSPTNADLLAPPDLHLDLVVVSSPMSVVGRPLRADLAARRLARFYLGREATAMRRRGTPVLVFQPTSADVAVMGYNAMDGRRAARVARQAFESATRRIEHPRVGDHVELLRTRQRA